MWLTATVLAIAGPDELNVCLTAFSCCQSPF